MTLSALDPEALRRLLRALEHVTRSLLAPPPLEVDRTPRCPVDSRGRVTLSRFQGGTPSHGVPVLLVPALMVRPYLFDLRPGHSLAGHLLGRGFDVFLLDFGVPDEADARLRLGDYAFSFLPWALQAVARVRGAPGATLVGYCTGGLFSLLAAAGREPGVRNLVLLACPVDFQKMGLLHRVTRRYHRQLLALIDQVGYVPGFLPSLAVEAADPLGSLVRHSSLLRPAQDPEERRRRQALSRWLHDLVPGPRDAWKEFLRTFVVENALTRRRFALGDRVLDLGEVRCPVLAMAGRRDPIAPVEAARGILDLVGSDDRTFAEVPGGHVGLVAGSSAPRTTWTPLTSWLEARSASSAS